MERSIDEWQAACWQPVTGAWEQLFLYEGLCLCLPLTGPALPLPRHPPHTHTDAVCSPRCALVVLGTPGPPAFPSRGPRSDFSLLPSPGFPQQGPVEPSTHCPGLQARQSWLRAPPLPRLPTRGSHTEKNHGLVALGASTSLTLRRLASLAEAGWAE